MDQRTDETLAHAERLVVECRRLDALVEASNGIIVVRPRVSSGLPAAYDVDLRISTVSSVDRQGRAHPCQPVRLRISVESDYPIRPPRVTVDPSSVHVFHPHVRPKSITSPAEWIDYQIHDPSESLASTVLRIASSLQYRPEFVNERAPRLGNRSALTWFLNQQERGPRSFFPYDSAILPHPEEFRAPASQAAATQLKTFAVVPRGETASERVAVDRPITDPQPLLATKTFRVAHPIDAVNPRPAQRPAFALDRELPSERRELDPPRYEVYVLPAARREMFEHVGWGESTEQNLREQGGLLVGDVNLDVTNNILYAVVAHAVPGETARGDRAHLELDHSTWQSMVERADVHRSRRPGAQIVGWYHTHPAALDVFMSPTDLATQRTVFREPWQCAIVLNPQARRWRAFAGANADECNGFFVTGDDRPGSSIVLPESRVLHRPSHARRSVGMWSNIFAAFFSGRRG